MTSRVDAALAAARDEGRAALMPFVVGGYPDLDATERTLVALDEAGADVVEIGIPFSDPIADGPVIAAAMHEALAGGAVPAAILDLVRRVRPRVGTALVAMVSDSIVQRLGGADFVDRAADAGFDGLIVPDLDIDDAPALRDRAAARDMAFALLVAPTTTPARLARIAGLCRGFVYLLARTGLTGVRDEMPPLGPRIEQVRAVTDLPIAVGFGISRAEHVAAVAAVADAAIVGSALVRRQAEADDPAAAAADLVRSLAPGLAAGRG